MELPEKAKKIFFKKKPEEAELRKPKRVILPTNKKTVNLSKSLNREVHQVVTTTSKTIRQLLRPKGAAPTETAGVYKVPCKTCQKIYIGETSRSLTERLKEHKKACKNDDKYNAIAQHRTEFDHPPDFGNATLLKTERNKYRRWCMEAACIQECKETMEQAPGFMKISPHLSKVVVKQNRIKI